MLISSFGIDEKHPWSYLLRTVFSSFSYSGGGSPFLGSICGVLLIFVAGFLYVVDSGNSRLSVFTTQVRLIVVCCYTIVVSSMSIVVHLLLSTMLRLQ